MSEIFVNYNKIGDASGTFEIFFFCHTTFTFHIRYILHLRETLFFFIIGDTSSTFFTLDFRTTFANTQDSISNLRKSPFDLSVVFVQYTAKDKYVVIFSQI